MFSVNFPDKTWSCLCQCQFLFSIFTHLLPNYKRCGWSAGTLSQQQRDWLTLNKPLQHWTIFSPVPKTPFSFSYVPGAIFTLWCWCNLMRGLKRKVFGLDDWPKASVLSLPKDGKSKWSRQYGNSPTWTFQSWFEPGTIQSQVQRSTNWVSGTAHGAEKWKKSHMDFQIWIWTCNLPVTSPTLYRQKFDCYNYCYPSITHDIVEGSDFHYNLSVCLSMNKTPAERMLSLSY